MGGEYKFVVTTVTSNMVGIQRISTANEREQIRMWDRKRFEINWYAEDRRSLYCDAFWSHLETKCKETRTKSYTLTELNDHQKLII